MRRLLHTTTEINIVFNFCPNRDTIGESIGGEDMFILRFDVESAYALHPSVIASTRDKLETSATMFHHFLL